MKETRNTYLKVPTLSKKIKKKRCRALSALKLLAHAQKPLK